MNVRAQTIVTIEFLIGDHVFKNGSNSPLLTRGWRGYTTAPGRVCNPVHPSAVALAAGAWRALKNTGDIEFPRSRALFHGQRNADFSAYLCDFLTDLQSKSVKKPPKSALKSALRWPRNCSVLSCSSLALYFLPGQTSIHWPSGKINDTSVLIYEYQLHSPPVFLYKRHGRALLELLSFFRRATVWLPTAGRNVAADSWTSCFSGRPLSCWLNFF